MPRDRSMHILVVFLLLGVPGCGAWVSERPSQCTFSARSTFDGSQVYPLDMVVLGYGPANPLLKPYLQKIQQAADQAEDLNRVLLAGECGVFACYANDMGMARAELDKAIVLATSIVAPGAGEASAKSLRGTEGDKRFKGEPHERALLYLFRGLVYLADGDPENARACFKSAALMDAMAAKDVDRGDWQSVDGLTLLMNRILDDVGMADDLSDYIARRYGLSKDQFDLPNNGSPLVIVVTGVGPPPTKYSREAQLRYHERKSLVKHVVVTTSAAFGPLEIAEADDVFVQAVSRGQRNMDLVLKAKAESKEAGEGTGGTLLGLGSAAGGLAGLAFQLVGGLVMESASKIDTRADIRQFQSMPGKVYLWYSNSLPPFSTIMLEMQNASGQPVARSSVTVPHGKGPFVVLAKFAY